MNVGNFIGPLFSNLPTLTLATIVVILAFSKKFYVNWLLIISCILSLISAVTSLVFWSTIHSSNEVKSFLLMTNLLFSSVSSMFLYGIIDTILETNKSIDRKQSVLGMIGLSLVTLGFYIPYWYLKRNKQFKAGNFVLILYIFLLVPSIVAHGYQSSDVFGFSRIILVLTNIATAITVIFLALNLRVHILNENEEIEINPVLTFFFGAFYLQYMMNKIETETA